MGNENQTMSNRSGWIVDHKEFYDKLLLFEQEQLLDKALSRSLLFWNEDGELKSYYTNEEFRKRVQENRRLRIDNDLAQKLRGQYIFYFGDLDVPKFKAVISSYDEVLKGSIEFLYDKVYEQRLPELN